jgi:tRNA threonylcarbamoyladenosine biosynthesis protein TsaB
MYVLGLDTSTFTASVALARGTRMLATAELDTSAHSTELLATVHQVLEQAGVVPAALDAIAVGAGPGSFTGLRIGLATAKGLGFALERPVWAVSSLAAMAFAAGRAEVVLVPIMDARRGEVYAGFFRLRAGVPVELAPEVAIAPTALAAQIAKVRDAAAVVVFGNGLLAHGDSLASLGDGVFVDDSLGKTPTAAAVALLAQAGAAVDALEHGAPSYVRPAEAEVKYPDGVPGALPRR